MFAILSLAYGKRFSEQVKLGMQNKREYCEKYNVPFITDDSVIDHSRRLQWSKIRAIQKYLDSYEYLLWLDSDTYITNFNITPEMILEIMSGNDMVLTQDPYGSINVGFVLVKNTPFIKALFTECYKHLDKICDEQGSIIHLYQSNFLEAQNKVRIIPHNIGMNSYWFTWKEGNFMIHFPGCNEPDLKKTALDYMMYRFYPEKHTDESKEEYEIRKQGNTSLALIKEKQDCKSVLPKACYKD